MTNYNDRTTDEQRIQKCAEHLAKSTLRLQELSMMIRHADDNGQANMAYRMWLEEMQKFEYLTNHLRQVAMGGSIPPFY